MTFLPIVDRELRMLARRPATYWGRVAIGAGAAAFGGYLLVMFESMQGSMMGATIGSMMFTLMAGFGFFYTCVAGVQQSADAISSEKREGTLGFLFLTDLKGYDIALGKLGTAGISSFYMLLTMLPVFSFVVFLGGVEGATVWRAFLALLNMLFFSQCAGLMVSSFSHKPRKALIGASIVLCAFLIGLPLLADTLRVHGLPRLANFINLFAPSQAYSMASQVHVRTRGFWEPLLGSNFVAWLFLGITCWHTPRCWQEKGVRDNTGWNGLWKQWSYGNTATRTSFRNQLTAVNPFYWLVSRTRIGPALVWLGLVSAGVFIMYVSDPSSIDNGLTLAVVLHTILKVWLSSEAAYHFEDQRRSGALELLLAGTLMEPKDIVRGQWRALRRQFLGPTVFVLAVDAAVVLTSGWRTLGWNSVNRSDFQRFIAVLIAGMLALVADMFTLGWSAMWRAMSQSKTRRAAGGAILQVMMLPWLAFGVLSMVTKGTLSFYAGLIVWFSMSMIWDAVVLSYSRRQLLERFRELAPANAEHIGWLGLFGRMAGKAARAARLTEAARRTA